MARREQPELSEIRNDLRFVVPGHAIGDEGIGHSSDTSVGFERDAFGRITALTDPFGNTQRYAYSAAGDLVSHEDALGNVTRFF